MDVMKKIFSDDMSSFLWRFTVNSVLVWSILGVYMVINNHPPSSPAVLTMPGWVPFWPIFTLPYLGLLWITWVLPLAIRNVGRFFGCWFGMLFAYSLAITLFLLFPTTLPRPPIPDGWGTGLYRGLAAIDPPNNVMPAAHGIGPMVAAWFTVRDRPSWRWPLIGMLMLGLPSIALVWQHRPIDIVLGLVAAAIGITIGEALSRRGWAKLFKKFE